MKINVAFISFGLITLISSFLLVGCHHFGPNGGKVGKLTSAYKTPTDDGPLGDTSPFLMPYNRIIDGAGQSVSFGDASVENHSLDAVLLPDQKTLVVEDRFGIAFFDVKQRKLISRWDYNKGSALKGSMSSFSGIKAIVHHDSTYIFWGAGGRGKPNSHVMQVVWDGSRARLVRAIPFTAIAPATIALPNEVVLQEEAGELMLYTVLNGNNQLVKLRVKDQKVIWTAPTGVAPFGLTILGTKAYVTNWAG
ncbi:MAG: phosphoesterase, partial [Cytophagaceae bacterium]